MGGTELHQGDEGEAEHITQKKQSDTKAKEKYLIVKKNKRYVDKTGEDWDGSIVQEYLEKEVKTAIQKI